MDGKHLCTLVVDPEFTPWSKYTLGLKDILLKFGDYKEQMMGTPTQKAHYNLNKN